MRPLWSSPSPSREVTSEPVKLPPNSSLARPPPALCPATGTGPAPVSALACPVGPWFSTETPRSSLKRCFLKIRSERPSALTFPSPAPGPGGVVSAQHSSPSGTLCCSHLHRGSSPVFPLKWKDLPGETRGGSPPAMFPAPGTPQAHRRSAIKARRRREEPARPSRLQPRRPRNSILLP